MYSRSAPSQADSLLARKASHEQHGHHQQQRTTLHAPSTSSRGGSVSLDRDGSVRGNSVQYPPPPPPWLPTAAATSIQPASTTPHRQQASRSGQQYFDAWQAPISDENVYEGHHKPSTPFRTAMTPNHPPPSRNSMLHSTTVDGLHASHPIGLQTSHHASLMVSHLSRDGSLAEQLREKDKLLEQCLRDKRSLESRLQTEQSVVASERRRIRVEVFNEFMHALRHGGIVAVEALGARLQHGGDGVSPKADDEDPYAPSAAHDVPHFSMSTPLPHAKTNSKAREEATIRVRNALALLQQPRSSSVRSL